MVSSIEIMISWIHTKHVLLYRLTAQSETIYIYVLCILIIMYPAVALEPDIMAHDRINIFYHWRSSLLVTSAQPLGRSQVISSN